MNGTEQDFVHRINVKDEAAFHDLFTRFRNYLVLFAMRRVEQLDVAEDIVQGKAHEIDCIFKLRASVHKLSQGMLELAKQIPIYHEPAEINKTEADNDEG